MIGGITGVPGTGKSAFIVAKMLDYVKEGRPVFQHGIRECTVPGVERMNCGNTKCEFCPDLAGRSLHEFKHWAPANAVLFLDEVQQQFRSRATGAAVPKPVQDMETHRHGGVDIWVSSQNPKLYDQNIRDLQTLHYHIKPTFIGRFLYTWMTCPASVTRTADAQKSKYSPPKRAFQYYKSAEKHTKFRIPLPKALIALVVLVIVGAVLAYNAIGFIGGSSVEHLVQSPASEEGSTAVVSSLADRFQGGAQELSRPLTTAVSFDETPRITGVLESAPKFDGLVTFSEAPRMAACIATKARCQCYTQQATRYPTSRKACLDFIHAEPSSFNAYGTTASTQ